MNGWTLIGVLTLSALPSMWAMWILYHALLMSRRDQRDILKAYLTQTPAGLIQGSGPILGGMMEDTDRAQVAANHTNSNDRIAMTPAT